MKLWYSSASPYVRKVMATIKHHGLENQVEVLKVGTTSFDPNSAHNRDNPMGRIPALRLDNGEWLFNSLLIAEYLDAKGERTPLFPYDETRWQVLNLHALVDGIMENTMPMVAERMLRPEAEWWTSRHEQLTERNRRSFRQLQEKLKPFATELNIGTLAAVCLIDWWRFRQEKARLFELAEAFPDLADWTAEMNAKYPELAQTKPA